MVRGPREDLAHLWWECTVWQRFERLRYAGGGCGPSVCLKASHPMGLRRKIGNSIGLAYWTTADASGGQDSSDIVAQAWPDFVVARAPPAGSRVTRLRGSADATPTTEELGTSSKQKYDKPSHTGRYADMNQQ